MTEEEMLKKFEEVTAMTVAEQAKCFLREFINEFANPAEGGDTFEDVLNLCDEYTQYTDEKDRNKMTELDEVKFHLFLEKRGETQTIVEVRDKMRTIDLDSNLQISFMEYCLFKYTHTLAELFAEKPGTNAALLALLDEAIALHEAVLKARQEEEDKIADLTTKSKGTGVSGMRAKAELEQMRVRSQTGQNMAEVRSAFKKRQAEKALKNSDPMAEEMKKLAIKKKSEADAAQLKRNESKKRLAAKAAAFGN